MNLVNVLLAKTFASGQKSSTIFVEAAWMEVVISAIDFVLADKLEKLVGDAVKAGGPGSESCLDLVENQGFRVFEVILDETFDSGS